MKYENQVRPSSRTMLWGGRFISGVVIPFFLLDGAMKIVKPQVVVQATVGLGYNQNVITGLGITLLACTALYATPRTTVLGAILLTGYLGGAVASKVRIDAPLFDICFALVFGVLVWSGLWLRDPKLRGLLPLKSAEHN